MSDLIIDPKYAPTLSLRETEKAIKAIKDAFQKNLAEALNLQRVSAPLFLRQGSGVNDDLNGIEAKASFKIKADDYSTAEMLFSLAKWKRMVLADYGFGSDEGLYTDMNAVRPDEEALDNLHSVYVDQWDWERVMSDGQRNLDFLKAIVTDIYQAIRTTEQVVAEQYPQIVGVLPETISFVHTEDLAREYPDLTPQQREDKVAEKYGAVFIIGIGGILPDGKAHDGRAPDYDDWTTPTTDGKKGLNGDIFFWYPPLNRGFEISSMGIRVDGESLLRQLKIRDAMDRKDFTWHRRLLNNDLPQTIGGGIGQSRLCMFLLKKMHIGEVQASVWPRDVIEKCIMAGFRLL